jgi:hypothetical protein
VIGIVEQYPEIGFGWWWEFSHDGMRYSGHAFTKRSAMKAIKRRHKTVMKQGTGQRIEVELS